MPLVEKLPWQNQVIDSPPIKLIQKVSDYPHDIDLTFVGVRHDVDGSDTAYIRDLACESDVVFIEMVEWANVDAKNMQALANGKQSALKASYEQLRIGTHQESEAALWLANVHSQIFGTKVRYLPTDYPKGHPNMAKFHAMVNGQSGLITQHFPLLLDRESYVASHVTGKIAELRKHIETIRAKSPLKVTLFLGAAHYAVAETLSNLAAQVALGDFTTRIMFDDAADLSPNEYVSSAVSETGIQLMVDYQNWLRTSEN